MKEVICCKCGNVIEQGYAINPQNSAICESCYNEEVENLEV